MNIVIAYLDSMFSTYPQSPRLLQAKAELHAMMEDAYTSLLAQGLSENEAVGQVIRDFGNLNEIAPALGIASDLGAVAGAGTAETGRPATPAPYPPVTLEEAQEYAAAHQRTRFRLSAAVVLFVLSPIVLILLPAAGEAGLLPVAEQAGVFIGLLALLVVAAAGVVLFISAARVQASPRRIAEGRFAADPVVTRWADALAERHERGRIRALQLAVTLCIAASIPLIAFVLFLDGSPHHEVWIAAGVVIVLAVVAVALGILLPRAWAQTVADKLARGARARR